MHHARHRRRVAAAAPLVVAALAACAGQPPSILTIPETTVNMNSTLEFDVAATDPDSDELTFSLRNAPRGATLSPIAGKIARFTWTPNPAQVGVHTLTFIASDGSTEDEETVNVKVVGGGAPELVSPDRYVVDLNASSIVKFVLEFRDDDSSELDFGFEPDPAEWGAEVKTAGKRVIFTWEPTEEQKATAQHAFFLTATDADQNEARRTITVIFRGVANETCGSGKSQPVVAIEDIANQSGEEDYPVVTRVSDRDSEIQYAVVFWSTVADPKDGDWEHRALTRGEQGGTFEGTIPNLQLNPGESATVTWHVCAADNDDPGGDYCDGWACAENKTFTASASLGICDPCQPGQCGGGLCLENSRGETFCGGDCGSGDSCDAGFYCETISLSGGGTKKQCIPNGCRNGSSDPLCSCAAGRAVAPSPGDLAINEVLFDPPDSCPDGQTTCETTAKLSLDVNGDGVRKRDEGEEEFVELVNRTSSKYLQLQGATLADSDKVRFTFPAFVLPPGRAVVVFGGGDATKFGGLGGAYRFSSAGTAGSGPLQLNNAGDTVTLVAGGRTIDTATWPSTAGRGQSITRQKEGDPSATLVSHSQAPGASGAKWSPGAHACGSPFPLDTEACIAPTCAVTNQDQEPASDARSTAPCLRPLPQTVSSTLQANQSDPSTNDARDVYLIDGVAGKWLHARTEAGASPGVEDTVLKLLARNGSQVEQNDDDPWNATSFYSRLVFQFPSDGIYFLEVTPLVVGTTPRAGSYRLVVETSATQPQKPTN